MVRENRIKSYKFQGTDLAGNSASVINVYSEHPLNGLLQAIQVENNNFAAAGSLYVSVSGIGETVWSLNSGTATGMTSESGTYLPRGSARTTANDSLSGTGGAGVWAEFPLLGVMHLHGGIGPSKSGLGISINYI